MLLHLVMGNESGTNLLADPLALTNSLLISIEFSFSYIW